MLNKERNSILDRREMLKVKIKSLAAESRLIRIEETKVTKANAAYRAHAAVADNSWSADNFLTELREHRTKVVRPACRLANLAYGLIRGRTLEQMEPKSPTLTDLQKKQIREMVKKYGPRDGLVLPSWLEAPPQRQIQVKDLISVVTRV